MKRRRLRRKWLEKLRSQGQFEENDEVNRQRLEEELAGQLNPASPFPSSNLSACDETRIQLVCPASANPLAYGPFGSGVHLTPTSACTYRVPGDMATGRRQALQLPAPPRLQLTLGRSRRRRKISSEQQDTVVLRASKGS
ncbi:unnamed protein product, partial [Protopolystoma xenopodis]